MRIYDATQLSDGTLLGNSVVWRWLESLRDMVSGDPAPVNALCALWAVARWVQTGAEDPRDDASTEGVACCDQLVVHGLLVPADDGQGLYDEAALALIRHMVAEEHLLIHVRQALRRGSFGRQQLKISTLAVCLMTGQHEPQPAVESQDEDDADDQEFWDGI